MSEDILTLPAVPEPAEAAPDSLYRFSTWLHVGHGADDCTEVDTIAGVNRCGDPAHFHAWCRLPNDFQRREIIEHATAAGARKRRQMRMEGTTAHEVLEEGLDRLLREEGGLDKIRDELLAGTWYRDYMDAVRETRDLDDPDWTPGEGEADDDAPKLFADIDQDTARFQRLQSEGYDPKGDELKELAAHMALYQVRIQERLEARIAPRRQGFEALDSNELLDLLRNKRVELAGQDEFMHHYAAHEWLACTYTQRASDDTYFRDLKHMENASPEVLFHLRETFGDLERIAQGASGN
jgi:hypothetical protein